MPRLLEQLALHLEAVAEEDHDERHRGELGDEAAGRVEVEHSGTALTEREARQDEDRVSARNERRATPETNAPSTSSAPKTSAARSKSPAWQDAGGACSGYLVEEQGTRLLLDCGSGVFAKLRAATDYVDVDAVIITHLHADHFFDLVPFASALTYAPRQQPVPVDRWPGTDAPARPALHAPHGARDSFRQVCAGGGMFAQHIEEAFALREYDVDDELTIGPLRVRFHGVPHYLPTHAVEITGATGRMTFGADHAPSQELVAFAEGTDLLLIEATLPRPERGGVRGHLTPSEAGDHGARAHAGRLVLTHISDELDQGWARDQAAAAFPGPVEVAADGSVFEV